MWKPTHATHILGFLSSRAISSPLNHSSGLVKGPSGQEEKGGPTLQKLSASGGQPKGRILLVESVRGEVA